MANSNSVGSTNNLQGKHVAVLDEAQTFTKAQTTASVALTSTTNHVATNASLSTVFTHTLTENTTIDNPTNLVSGGQYTWIITQGAGPYTVALGNVFQAVEGTFIVNTVNGSKTILYGTYNGTNILYEFSQAGGTDLENQVYVAKNGINSAGGGTLSAPFLDPFYATLNTAGSSTNGKVITVSPGIYTGDDLALKPNIGYLCTRFCPFVITNPITADTSWGSATNGSAAFMDHFFTNAAFNLNFSTFTPTSLTMTFSNCTMLSTFAVTGQDTSQVVTRLRDSQISSAVTLTSCITIFEECDIDSDVTLTPKVSGTGTTEAIFVGCEIGESVANSITVSGASGRECALTIYNSTVYGDIVLDGTFCEVTVDSSSYPRNGFSLANGATMAQVTVIRQAAVLLEDNAFTGTNYVIPSAITSTTNSTAWATGQKSNATYVAVEDTTLATATGQKDGAVYTLRFQQHASSPKTFAFASTYKFPGGVVPVVSTGANAVDIFTFRSNGTNMECEGYSLNIS